MMQGTIEKSGRALVMATVFWALSLPTLAAPVDQNGDSGGSPAPQRGAEGERLLPGPSAARSKAEAVLSDRNDNRLSDGLEATLAASGPNDRIDVIVTFSGLGNATAAQAAVGAFEVRHEYDLIQGFAATMTAAQARAMAGVAGVFRVEQDATASVFLEAARADFGVDRVWADTGLTGAGVDICVIDTGIEWTHEQFVDGTANKVVGFIDFVGDMNGVLQTVAYDDHGHGTHVAAIAAGDGTGSPLASRLAGVAPAASIYAARVLNAEGSGPVSGIIAAVDWCVAQQVDVINMSLGAAGSSDGQDSLSQASNQAVAAGVVVVVAAGNSGAVPETIGSPAAAESVMTVGAAAEWSADPNDAIAAGWFTAGMFPAPFSSRGPTRDGRIKPDIMAPGVTIGSALADYTGIYKLLYGCDNDCYVAMSGTSMASPFMAGVAALMLQADPALTPDELAQIVYGTARDRATVAGKDNDTGHGLLDAYAALAQVAPAAVDDPTAFPSYATGVGSVGRNQSTRIPIHIAEGDTGAPLAVTVTIDGSFGAFGWNPDLEARLLDGDGNPFMVPNPLYPVLSPDPTIPDPATYSACPGDDLCGVAGRQETVYIAAPSPGTYLLEVFPFPDWPNRGKGGSFTYEISRGPLEAEAPPPAGLAADAGPDQTVTDSDNSGSEIVQLDGSGSSPGMSYSWTDGDGLEIADVMSPALDFALGEHSLTLTVSDGSSSASDSVLITVRAKKGGGNGGGRGGGKNN
jgi:serine protease AprX